MFLKSRYALITVNVVVRTGTSSCLESVSVRYVCEFPLPLGHGTMIPDTLHATLQ